MAAPRRPSGGGLRRAPQDGRLEQINKVGLGPPTTPGQSRAVREGSPAGSGRRAPRGAMGMGAAAVPGGGERGVAEAGGAVSPSEGNPAGGGRRFASRRLYREGGGV